jgi:hypothetical protein
MIGDKRQSQTVDVNIVTKLAPDSKRPTNREFQHIKVLT